MMTRIPHSMPLFGEEERKAVEGVLRNGFLSEGPEVESFERVLADFLGRREAVFVSSGTLALFLVLKSMDIGHSDQVILPDLVCSSVYYAVRWAGATPIPVDVDENGLLSSESLLRVVNRSARAVILVDLFGKLCRVAPIEGVPFIRDAAQSIGGNLPDNPETGVISTYATKMITTMGTGGAVFTNDGRTSARIRELKKNDRTSPGEEPIYFYGRTGETAAAFGKVQVSRLPGFVKTRREIWKNYYRELSGILEVLEFDEDEVPFRCILKLESRDRDSLLERLRSEGIEAAIPVSMPVHKLQGVSDRDFPRSVRLAESLLSLPLYPGLIEQDQERIIETVKHWRRA